MGIPLHLAGACKLELIPLNTTMFLVRIENLADQYFDTYYKYYERYENDTDYDIPQEDKPEDVIPDFIDVDKLITLLVQKHVGSIAGIKMSIAETSLTGTELYSEMVSSKTKWSSLDDEWIDESNVPKDHENGRQITLEPQRIRTFRVAIEPAKKVLY